MKKVLLFSQDGDGLRFKWLTSGYDELDEYNGKHVANGSFFVADIIFGIQGDIDDMILTVPHIINCPQLHYHDDTDTFRPLL